MDRRSLVNVQTTDKKSRINVQTRLVQILTKQEEIVLRERERERER